MRKAPYVIPSYSLTGDLLSFLRCGLQYRYGTLGRLPATRPAQLWFGQFIHGVLEESYRRYLRYRDEAGIGSIPHGQELTEVLEFIMRRLSVNGLRPRNADLERIGCERAVVAVEELGPELFPLISEAEVPLNGTRRLPVEGWPDSLPRRESDRYEMAGIVDVITRIALDDPHLASNRIVQSIVSKLHGTHDDFEVIVDYKGMRRPPRGPKRSTSGPDYWNIYDWQLQTYAQLRSVQPGSRPVAGGVLIFLNELRPTWSDLASLRQEMREGSTDVYPASGSEDQAFIARARKDGPAPELSFEFRLDRALRVVSISPSSQESAASHFDDVVWKIEQARAKEQQSLRILTEWEPNRSDEATCAACDWRSICPSHPDSSPSLPRSEA